MGYPHPDPDEAVAEYIDNNPDWKDTEPTDQEAYDFKVTQLGKQSEETNNLIFGRNNNVILGIINY